MTEAGVDVRVPRALPIPLRVDEVPPPPERTLLRDHLERVIGEVQGTTCKIVSLRRMLSPHWSSYPVYLVTTRLEDGTSVRVFMKDFGYSRRVKREEVQRRDREYRVYRDLLDGQDLGTARFYGAVWDDSSPRHWLFLEALSGTQLGYCDTKFWIAAAGWLGKLQATFGLSQKRLEACDFLAHHDRDFFWSRAESALREVPRYSRALARRLSAIVDQYVELVDEMAAPPKTLVHGAYRPQNLLVVRGPSGIRLCPTDWERAAVGSTLYDLACISDGFEPPDLDEMWGAYRESAEAGGVPVPNRDHIRFATDCFRLHRTFNWLSVSSVNGYTQSTVERLVGRARQLAVGLS